MAGRNGADAVPGEASKGLPLRPLAIPDASSIDGLKLLATGDSLVLLFSTQERKALGGYELLIRAASVTAPTSVTKVATVERLLPVPPMWDARLTESGAFELVFELAGGAINALRHQAGGPSAV